MNRPQMKYVDKEAMEHIFRYIVEKGGAVGDGTHPVNCEFVLEMLDMYTVNAIAPVCCRDCRFAEYTHNNRGETCFDTIYCERNDLQADADWYCADWFKREREHDEVD